ncbi:uncharacterized protein M421DRAFT_65303 [Didymella exigua CBS 183.55]|uniref:ARM repeat-containing protein n=1 Tax=Didymella exigua CBS 183.55 TaxID=1150837 RepID=A0A6A5RG30_9PLEO|nr:uncharacterized protein M421DRAFT_65303 [Didymella exigua CBS 183.55]KAF1927291.1 hypothetical protein M421DRAFT_65303 [Didymella exigua CBS 183.55]
MERQQAFQRLKQPCIELLQVTAALAQRQNGKRELVQALTNLLDALTEISAKPHALDAKLAEYAFVPVSQVLRLSRQVPVRALELCLDCVSVLLRSGWGGGMEPALSGQLLILFTFLAKPSSAENGIAATSEELQALAFKCVGELLAEGARTASGREALTATDNIPALGEAVLTTLDSLVESSSNSIKLAAVHVVKALTSAIVDDDALASFLPKLVSSLTKVLTPGSANKAGYRTIEQSLEALTRLFQRLLSDRNTANLPEVLIRDAADDKQMLRSKSWLQATASQIKIALANIYKMRNHDKSEARKALLRLCLCVIRDCRVSLADSTSMSIETVISLVGRDGSKDTVEDDLRIILVADQRLVDVLRECLHDWVVSFPRVMQSKDDGKRRLIIHQISVTLRLLGQDPVTIDDRLADGLRDGVSAVLADSKGLEEVGSGGTAGSMETGLILGPSRQSTFQPLQLRLKGQQDLMTEFTMLLSQMAKSDSALNVVQNLVRTINMGTEEMQLASYWVSVNLIRDLTVNNPSFDDFIDSGSSNPREELLDDLYSHSVMLLTERDPSTNLPWHFYALALETVALQAGRYRMEFRAELGEVLYPILHQLGSPNPALREHAITCLNILSDASGYSSARDLVVDNVDYVVNAVGLKLAVGDVSPQAPQVLLMMMRLCGPSLLPYLDDLVGSIFEALERYHGYPVLVELLFSVLKGMTEEGVKAPQLALEGRTISSVGSPDISISTVITTLAKIKDDKQRRAREADEETPVPFPEKPWAETAPAEDAEEQPPPETPEPPPPAPRTFSLLLKIADLTQHYLPSHSPSLRTSLLALLRTAIPALARHENSFLPLVNTLWPVLLPRLQDREAYVVASTLEVIGVMCEHAGGFMRSRIEAAFPVLRAVHKRTQERASKGQDRKPQSTGGGSHAGAIETHFQSLSISAHHPTNLDSSLDTHALYSSTPTRMIWDALVSCLCAIAAHVGIRDEHFELVLDMLDPVLARPDVRQALDKANADALWLRMYRRRAGGGMNMPVLNARLGARFVLVSC